MISKSNQHSWIFVSHSSDDLVRVRLVRNYLEERGASPLLFHLLALNDPEEFWPLIEKEIKSRNFFYIVKVMRRLKVRGCKKSEILSTVFQKKGISELANCKLISKK